MNSLFQRADIAYAKDMESIPSLGNVEFLPVREVWANEATSFTPWLLANEQVLADLLGLEIELTEIEQRVGSFSLDLFGKNLTDNTNLIVENQLEKTDHSHLGQLLTYAGGLNPSTIVWIASEFRDEHRAALDWLNQVSDENTHFFGVVVKALRIGDSKPAPWLELVVKPNQWTEETKRATQSAASSESQDRYLRFWEGFIESQKHRGEVIQSKIPAPRSFLTVKTGIGGVRIGLGVQKRRIFSDLFFCENEEKNMERFEHLLRHKDEVEAVFGAELSWEPLEEAKATRVGYYGEGSILDEVSWARSQDWLGDACSRFIKVIEMKAFQELRHIG